MKQIGLVSFMRESNSFNPEKTDYEMFAPLTGDQIVATWIHTHHEVGGKSVEMHGRPVPITGTVCTLNDGFFIEREVRHGGKYRNNQGLTSLVETTEGHSVILTSERMAPMSLEQVRSVGMRPEWKRILIAKGAIAPRAAYESVSKQVIEVDTPGVSAAASPTSTGAGPCSRSSRTRCGKRKRFPRRKRLIMSLLIYDLTGLLPDFWLGEHPNGSPA